MKYKITSTFEFVDPENNFHYTSSEYELKFLSMIQEGNVAGVLELMPNTYDETFFVGKLSDDKIRQERYLAISGSALMVRAAIAGGISQSEAMYRGDNFVYKIDKIDDIVEISRLFVEFVIDLTKSVSEIRNFSHNPYVRKAIRFIHYNINKKITVKDIAENIGITPNYLSSLFLKDTGINLNEYITITKINEAKSLLAYTSKPYITISNHLNFPDQSYFIEKFKKYVGMTPKQFREQNQ